MSWASGGGGGNRKTVLAWGCINANYDTVNTRYISIDGTDNFIYNTENQVQVPIACAGTIRNMYAHLNNSPGVGKSYTFTLRVNGANTTLSVTISGADTQASDLVNEVAVNAGDLISISVTPAAGPTARQGSGSFEFEV